MTISDGNAITAADLNALTTAQQAAAQADNAQLPLGFPLNLFFATKAVGGFNVVPSRRAKAVFVAPCDVYLESVAAMSGQHTNPSTTTIDVTGDGALGNWPTRITGSVGASPANMPRLLYDNTKTKPGAGFNTDGRAFRVYPRGTTITVQATDNSVTTLSMLQVALVFRQFFQRE